MPQRVIAVIGAGECDEATYALARDVGAEIARGGFVLVTGGRAGVMEATSRGAKEAGGLVVGILPDADPDAANEYVDIAIPTGMGQLRNGLVVLSACAVIAVSGEFGTLSEIGFALKLGRPVIGLQTWNLVRAGVLRNGILPASTAAEAVQLAASRCGGS